MNDVEEISLYELILLITKGWKIILITTITTVLLSFGVYLFYNQPNYESQTTGSIAFIQTQFTDIDKYTFPYSKSEDFIKILKNEDYFKFIATKTNLDKSLISESITYSVKDSNEIILSVSNSNPEITSTIMKSLKENNQSFLNYFLSNEVVMNLDLSKNTKLKSFNRELIVINRIITYLENKLVETNVYLGSNINPEYSSIINELESRKTEIKELEFNISDVEESIKLIDEFKSTILSFNDYLNSDSKLLISELELNYEDNQSFEAYRFSAKTLFPIASILGIMLGVFIVFFKHYWLTNSQANLNTKI